MTTVARTTLAMLVLALGGCFGLSDLGGPEGTWVVDGARMKAEMTAAAEHEVQAQLADLSGEERAWREEQLRQAMNQQIGFFLEFLETLSMELTLEPGGRWTSVSQMLGTTETASGAWESRGAELVLTTLEKDGRQLAEPTVDVLAFEGGEIQYREDGAPTAFILSRKP